MPKTPPPQLGDFDRQVTWQRLQTTARDAYGEPIKTGRFLDLGTLWVAIRQANGREAAYAERLKITATYVIECLYPGPMLATDRFKFIDPHTGLARYFAITNASDTDLRSFAMTILATEIENPSEDPS